MMSTEADLDPDRAIFFALIGTIGAGACGWRCRCCSRWRSS